MVNHWIVIHSRSIFFFFFFFKIQKQFYLAKILYNSHSKNEGYECKANQPERQKVWSFSQARHQVFNSKTISSNKKFVYTPSSDIRRVPVICTLDILRPRVLRYWLTNAVSPQVLGSPSSKCERTHRCVTMASTPGQNVHLVVPLVNSSVRCLKSLCRRLITYHLVLSTPLLLVSSRRVTRQLVVSLVKSPCRHVARQFVVSLVKSPCRLYCQLVVSIVNSSLTSSLPACLWEIFINCAQQWLILYQTPVLVHHYLIQGFYCGMICCSKRQFLLLKVIFSYIWKIYRWIKIKGLFVSSNF